MYCAERYTIIADITLASPTHELVEVDEHERDVAVSLGDAHEDEVVVLHVHERDPLHREHRFLLHLIPLLDVVAGNAIEDRKNNAGSASYHSGPQHKYRFDIHDSILAKRTIGSLFQLLRSRRAGNLKQ